MNDDKIPADVTADFEGKLDELRKGPFLLRLYSAGNSPQCQGASRT